jgi:hypothetical protein
MPGYRIRVILKDVETRGFVHRLSDIHIIIIDRQHRVRIIQQGVPSLGPVDHPDAVKLLPVGVIDRCEGQFHIGWLREG